MPMFDLKGKINSVQSFGAADGPGVRFVVFMQGCPLRCVCCHNPETWSLAGGTEITVEELCEKIVRCKNYFGKNGGVTVSGGEPLIQAEFIRELFERLKKLGINTALDTSGCVLNPSVKELLKLTDIVILDYKYTNDSDYIKYTGCEKANVDIFLDYLNSNNIRTWIRQVIIPDLNNTVLSVEKLADLKNKYACIEKIELLPFRSMCSVKYSQLNISFPLKTTREPTDLEMETLKAIVKNI